jgi:hypothetical protein
MTGSWRSAEEGPLMRNFRTSRQKVIFQKNDRLILLRSLRGSRGMSDFSGQKINFRYHIKNLARLLRLAAHPLSATGGQGFHNFISSTVVRRASW